MHSTIFTEVSVLLAIGTAIALLMRVMRQPLIIGHILTGILVGPSILGLVQTPDTIAVFGNFGIALLLFIVGLGLNPKVIKEVGRVSLLAGLGQVIFTSALGFGMAKLLGYSNIVALYICVALTFSSTIIILKLLSDKKEHNKLYGKISIGLLLVQDLIATFALVFAAASGHGGLSLSSGGLLAAKGIWLGMAVFLTAKYVITPMTNFLSKSQELLFLFALAWGFGVAALFFAFGFSLEVGALIGGVALSTMNYAQEVSSRLRPLRDFFIVVFFIALGAQLNLSDVSAVLVHSLLFSAFVLIGNPLIVMVIIGLLGYTKKTGFKAGLAIAQISEFSLIFILLGERNGQIPSSIVSMVTVVGIITIALSSYMIVYSDGIYKRVEMYLSIFERKRIKTEREKRYTYDAILVGYRRGGNDFIKAFKKLTDRFVVIDYDPDAVDAMESKGIPYLYGDASDAELLDEIDLGKAHLVVSNVTDHPTNLFLLQHLEHINHNAVTVLHADTVEQAAELYGLGASYVIMPHFIGTEKISSFIRKNGFKKSEFKKVREEHINYLREHYSEESDSVAA